MNVVWHMAHGMLPACLTALRRGFEEQAPARAVNPWVISAHLQMIIVDISLCLSSVFIGRLAFYLCFAQFRMQGLE